MADTATNIIIIGGGLAGLASAVGLASAGFAVTVVDRISATDQVDPGFDGRASAVAFASSQLLRATGVWPHVDDVAQPILEIRVSDGPSLLHLHFDHRDLASAGLVAGQLPTPLGYMVENRHMRLALQARAAELGDKISYRAPAEVSSIARDNAGVTVHLADGDSVRAPLLMGVDGRGSLVRRDAGIQVSGWGYGQVGIVCAIEHELSHGGVAHERFMPSGPFAILPLTDNRASLVWTEKAAHQQAIMALGPRAFEAEVQRRVGDFLGDVKVAGGRWSYPLTLSFADSYIAQRTALLGDAAHGIHPIAGQGLNMAFRDIAALVEILQDARKLGLDIGSADVLARYEDWRRFDNSVLQGVTDVLNRLFSNDIAPMRHARDVGLAVVDKIPPLKRFFMSHARGMVGQLPRLLTGEKL